MAKSEQILFKFTCQKWKGLTIYGFIFWRVKANGRDANINTLLFTFLSKLNERINGIRHFGKDTLRLTWKTCNENGRNTLATTTATRPARLESSLTTDRRAAPRVDRLPFCHWQEQPRQTFGQDTIVAVAVAVTVAVAVGVIFRLPAPDNNYTGRGPPLTSMRARVKLSQNRKEKERKSEK